MHVPFLKCFKRDKTEFLKYLQVPGSRISLQCITCPRGSDINTFELREQNHALDVSFSSRKLFYRSVEFGLTRVFQLRNKPFGSLFFVLMHDNFFFCLFVHCFQLRNKPFCSLFRKNGSWKNLEPTIPNATSSTADSTIHCNQCNSGLLSKTRLRKTFTLTQLGS